jgi:hypothetical protein
MYINDHINFGKCIQINIQDFCDVIPYQHASRHTKRSLLGLLDPADECCDPTKCW